MIINHNLNSMNAHRNMSFNTAQTGKAMEKLSSGLRINRAGDDAAGLAISEKMRGQIRGLDQATRNAQDGISLIQTAEGALNETHSILQRMRELGVQAANDTNVDADRSEIQKEINQLTSEINRIGNTTEFNTKKLLNGDAKGTGGVGLGQASSDFNFNVSTGDSGTTKLSIGGTEYNIIFNGAANYDNTAPATVDAPNKNITINTGATAPTATQLTDKLVAAFTAMRGTDPTLSISQFSFSNSLNNLRVTANSTGDFAGAAGKDSIEFVSGRSVTISNIVEGANGANGKIQLQTGANNAQAFVVEINNMTASSLGLAGASGTTANGVTSVETGNPGSAKASFTSTNVVTDGTTDTNSQAALDVSSHAKASKAVEVIDLAIKNVSAERSKLGASQNRLEHTINNLGTSAENLQAAESRIRDVDMAKEMMNFTKNNILNQAAQAMMSQSNQQPQAVLQLLR